MLRDEGVVVEPTWSVMNAVARCGSLLRVRETGASGDRDATDYREIDRQLRRIAKRKAGLDIEEARWLREAEKQRVWRKLGYSTALEYLEDVFGYALRTAMERLRVAKELGELPALDAAVRDGELPYSAARELTRVMTPETERAWLASARGRNLRDIHGRLCSALARAIVKTVLARGVALRPADDAGPVQLARQALVQLAFSSAIASQGVEREAVHVGAPIELAALIKEALRWCA